TGTGERGVMRREDILVEKRTLVDQLRAQLTRIEALQPEELNEALRVLGIDDQSTLKLTPLLLDAQAEEAKMLNSGLGELHPRVQALRAQRDIYRKQLSDQLESIKRAQK